MQSDYAWIAAMRTVPVKAEPAAHQSAEANHFHPNAAGARAWGDAQPNASHTHYDPHGSESESLTACGPSAAFADTGAPEVDSAAGAGIAASPLSPAAWPFVQRERSGTPVLHPVPRCAKILEAPAPRSPCARWPRCILLSAHRSAACAGRLKIA